jgi:hypothetical protein
MTLNLSSNHKRNVLHYHKQQKQNKVVLIVSFDYVGIVQSKYDAQGWAVNQHFCFEVLKCL